MRISEIITESEKRLGPDMNDPYEQGWYARPGHDFNPYERGTEQYNRWEDGHEERNAQPNHYDESIEESTNPKIDLYQRDTGKYLFSTTQHQTVRSAIASVEKKYPDLAGNITGQKSVKEGSMRSAEHKPEGPKFGGYYGATQRGAPKPGQGFGGAAESVGATLDEVAPPGMEDMVLKLKKQYPGEPQKAFATAWSIYNKKKGKK